MLQGHSLAVFRKTNDLRTGRNCSQRQILYFYLRVSSCSANTPATSEGYDITRIDIYHGWRDTGRDEGRVTVEYAAAADPSTFTEIVNASSANYTPPSQYGRIRLGSDSGVFIATNAVKIRFTFPSQENGQAGYSELDVFGLAVSDVMLTPSGGSTDVDEDGTPATDTYTVYLRSAPTGTVTVTPSFNSSEITVTPASLTFTPGNYGNAQTCTVTVVDDSEIEQTHVTLVGHTVTSTDTNYDGIGVADLEVTITDNDVPGTTVTKTDSVLDCATNDLLETAFDSVVSDVGAGEPILRDGEAGTRTMIANDRYATYTLDTTTEPSGYRIEQIDIYHGWGDDGRDEGRVTVEYELLSNPEVFYEIVNTAVYDPPGTYGRIRLTPDAGTFFATGVSKIRFKFPGPQENGGSGYAELDVIGSPPPPPPAGTVVRFR